MFAKRRITWALIIASTVVIPLTGCQEYRAKNSLQKTAQILSEIEQKYDGLTHEPERVNRLKTLVEQARNNLSTDPSQALDLASQARTEADLLVEATRSREANVRLARANEEIRVADINDLIRTDPDRYNRIRQVISDANAAQSQNKWDDVIRLADEAIAEVATGLAPVRTRADRKRLDAEQALTELRQNEGNRYAPEITVQVQASINEAIRIVERDRDFQLAANRFDDAIQRADQGITLVRSEKSREALELIESSLATALIEGAETYRPREYAELARRVEELNKSFRDGAFTTVLEASGRLREDAQTLVVQTKRAAARERIDNLARAIVELERGGVNDYIPNALIGVREQLARMRQENERDVEAAFDIVKEIYVDADTETERVRNQFQTVAINRIRDAKGNLETTRGVFDRMTTIFQPVTGEMTGEQRAFENQKLVRQSNLNGQLNEANVRIVTAELRQQEGRFRDAINFAGEVEELSAQILSEIFHTVAHNASIELAGLISRYEREGARQYAAAELVRSTERLEQVKAEIASQQFQRAVQTSAEARAEIELMAQAIAGRATVNLRNAEAALNSATSDKTRRFRAEMLVEVTNLIDTARGHLREQRLGLAVETADQATNLARRAESESNQLAADEALKEAREALTRAQDAGSELYAGREVEDSRRLISSAQSVYASGDFVKAEDLARSAITRARAALFKKINEAEAEIANAQAVGGWEFNDSRLASANTALREARVLLENRQYDESRRRAQSAASTAASLTVATKNHNFNTRIARLRENLKDGARQGVNFFQPEDAINARREIARLQNSYNPDNYDSIMVEVKRLEAMVRGTLDSTDELVETVAMQQGVRLDRLEENGADQFASVEIRQAREGLRFALLDYQRGMHKSAHSNLDRAIRLINEIDARRAQEEYSREVRDIYARFQRIQVSFDNILTLTPAELKSLATGPNGASQSVAIATQISPAEFRRSIDQLYSEALVINAPRELAPIHEAMIQSLTEARIAALNFEKLAILNRVSRNEAFLLIDQAYIRMNNSNRLVNDVQRQLLSDEVRFRLVNNRASNSGR